MRNKIVYALCYPDDFTPFYIGQGSKDRPYSHFEEAKKGIKTWKCNTIRKLLDEKREPIIEILHTELTKEEARYLEHLYITLIGRKDKNEGPLLNHTDGYEDECPGPRSKVTKEKIVSSLNNFYSSPKGEEQKQKISEWRKGKKLSEIMSIESAHKIAEMQRQKFIEMNKTKDNFGENNGFYGKRHSSESLVLMRESKRGDKNPNFGCKAFTEESYRKMREANAGSKHYNAKKMKFTFSDGSVHVIHGNFKKFCALHKLTPSIINELLDGKREYYKGITVEVLDGKD